MFYIILCSAVCCVERHDGQHAVLDQLGSVLNIVCLAVCWAVCCVERNNGQHFVLGDECSMLHNICCLAISRVACCTVLCVG